MLQRLFHCLFVLFVVTFLTSFAQTNRHQSSSPFILFPNSVMTATGSYSGGWNGMSAPTTKPRSQPPLHLLRSLGTGDWVTTLKTLGGNVRVNSSVTTGEQFLVDMDGKPILDERGKKVIVGGDGGVAKTQLTMIGLPGEDAANRTIGQPKKESPTVIGRMGNKPASPGWSVAACRPEERSVPVGVHYEPHIIHHPRCVRVERCGGCCGTDILACEASEKSTVDVPVQKFEYVADLAKVNFVAQEWVSVERHTKCECRCRTKPEDCTPSQVYRESECLCVCRNTAEQMSCSEKPLKVWDPTNCACTCRELRDCSSGFYFNLGTCECLPSKKRGARAHANSASNRRRS
ncbi:balbiani ring protein 3 [Folsomia candida]|uniref:balbiani ring protein 3 n=1 Tax=Folsomia candida TaxID=158441 RepID=UPI000B901209|nr:balbiani ring protein 3 [Folsomia candida]XP_021961459.1 balbiani ring protein 3 [Folsomia candida]XP_035700462.1 balbiani ring protein 3 [Folsomia candida]